MAKKKEGCDGCYQLVIDYCGEMLTMPTGETEGTKVWWQITDKFGERWRGSSTVDENGDIDIDVSLFPDGLFTPYAGNFTFVVFGTGENPPEDFCDVVELTICGADYDCIVFSVTKTNYIEPEE